MKETCKETLERAFLFLDGEVLTHDERVEIQVHLERCAPCFERVGLDKEVTALLARLRGAEQCPDRLKAKIAALLHDPGSRPG